MVIWVLRLFVPESPLWLARHGRTAEALEILRRIEAASGQALPDQVSPGALPARSDAATETAAPRVAAKATYAELFRPPYLGLVLLFMIFNLCQAFGFYGFANWVPTLLVEKGITVTKSLQYSFIIAVAYPVSALLAATFADRFERKWIISGAAVAIGGFGLLFARLADPAPLILCGVLLTAANTVLSYAYHAYQTEVFPTAVRARAAGLVYSMSRLSAMFSGFIIAYVLREVGVGGVFALITAAMIIVVVTMVGFGPNVRGKPLDAE